MKRNDVYVLHNEPVAVKFRELAEASGFHLRHFAKTRLTEFYGEDPTKMLGAIFDNAVLVICTKPKYESLTTEDFNESISKLQELADNFNPF